MCYLPGNFQLRYFTHMCKRSMAVSTPPELLSCMYMSTVAFPRFIVVFWDLHSGVPKFRDFDQALLCISLYSKRAQGLHLLLNRKCFLGSYSQWALAVKYIWINIYWGLNSSSFVSSACFLFFSLTFSKGRHEKILPCFYWMCFPNYSVNFTYQFTQLLNVFSG